jgi:hypothetical protein
MPKKVRPQPERPPVVYEYAENEVKKSAGMTALLNDAVVTERKPPASCEMRERKGYW